jgi:hypothetical protein
MKLINWALFSFIALLIAPQEVWAAKAANGVTPSTPLTNAPQTIERGGTVTGINLQRGTITVNGAIYSFASTFTGVPPGLKKNTKIRFGTIKDSISGKERVVGISISSPPGVQAPIK